MIHLPSSFKGVLAAAFAALLGAASAQADTTYQTAVNNLLLPLGKTIQTASVAQLQQATWGAISTGTQAQAGSYIHDVLILRSDKNSIAANLTAGALSFANALSNPSLAGTIAAQATATDLGLTASTTAAVAQAVILKMPIVARTDSALSVGSLVAPNFTGTSAETAKTTFATSVAANLKSSGNDVVGAFYAGVSTDIADWFAFSKVAIAKSSGATAEILADEITLSGALQASRIAASGSLAVATATGASTNTKALIAEGIVRASGTANTASTINTVLGLDHGLNGKEVTQSAIASFTQVVAGAVAKGFASQADAAATMRLITSTIAAGSYAPKAGTLGATLSEAQKAQVGSAAVKAALSIDSQPNENTANAATAGVLSTIGSLVNPSAFAITVAKGATKADNVGQVANAVAGYLATASSTTVAPDVYVALSGSMIKSFSSAATQISQRVAQLIPANVPGDNQAARVDYASRLSVLFPNSATSIAVGVSLTDTQYSDDVAKAVVNTSISTRNNAAKIAGAVANIVPAEEACEIASAMGGLIQSGNLKISQASAIASAIASGALVKTTPDELQVVAAQMIVSLMNGYVPMANMPNATQQKNNQTIISDVAAVAKSVAQIAYKNNVVKVNPLNDDQASGFANQVAGSAMQAVVVTVPNLDPTADQAKFELAIINAVQSVTPTSTGDHAVFTAVMSVVPNQTPIFAINCLNEAETPVTNY